MGFQGRFVVFILSAVALVWIYYYIKFGWDPPKGSFSLYRAIYRSIIGSVGVMGLIFFNWWLYRQD